MVGLDLKSEQGSKTLAEADSEVGSDLGLDLCLEQDSSSGTADPGTLAEYCAGPQDSGDLKDGMSVKANWKGDGMDMKYPGKVIEKNKDARYYDGFWYNVSQSKEER